MEHPGAFRGLQVDADAALAAVGAVRDVLRVPPRVAPGVDLDDVRTKVGKHLGAKGAGHREAEVEHGDAFEWSPVGVCGDGRRGPWRRGAITEHLVGVLAYPRDGTLHPPGGAAEPV